PVRGEQIVGLVEEIVQTERHLMTAEQCIRLVVQPRGVAELDRPALLRWSTREEPVEPIQVALPPGRKLNQRGTRGRAEMSEPVEMLPQPRLGIAQLLAMRTECPELDGELEARRCLFPPRDDSGG